MNKVVWIFTHDIVIDRRIIAYIAPFEKMGFNPYLIAGKSELIDNENVKIIRPHTNYEELSIGEKIKKIYSEFSSHSNIFLRNKNLFNEYGLFSIYVYNFIPIYQRVELAIKNHELPKPDLIFVNDLPTLPLGILYSKLYNCKLIVDCHEWWLEQAKIFTPEKKLSIDMIARFEREYYQYCDGAITVGRRLSQKMSQFYEREFITIYSSCINSRENNSKKYNLYKKFNIPENSKLAIFQGSLTPFRNLHLLIKSLNYFDENQFLIVMGDGILKDELIKLSKKFGVDDKVKFTGWINQEELINYSRNCHLGVMPHIAVNSYFSMSSPNKLFEYIAAELPILYDRSMAEIDDIISENGYGKSIDCSTAYTLGNGISDFLRNDSNYKSIKKNYKINKNNFSWENQEERFIKFVEKVYDSDNVVKKSLNSLRVKKSNEDRIVLLLTSKNYIDRRLKFWNSTLKELGFKPVILMENYEGYISDDFHVEMIKRTQIRSEKRVSGETSLSELSKIKHRLIDMYIYINFLYNDINSGSKIIFFIRKIIRNRIVNWYKLLYKMARNFLEIFVTRKDIYYLLGKMRKLIVEFLNYLKKDFSKKQNFEKENILDDKLFLKIIYDYSPMNILIDEKIFRIFKKPYLIFSLDFETFPLAKFHSNKLNIPLIYDENISVNLENKEKIRAIERYMKILELKTDLTIHSTEKFKNKDGEEVIYSGENDTLISKNNIHFYAKIPEESKVAICTSEISQKREFVTLIYSQIFSNDNYYLIFTNGGKYETDLKNLVDRLKLNKRVKFIGWLDDEQLLSSMKSSDLAIVIDRKNSFQIQDDIFDFINFKIPVLSSKNGFISEIVEKNRFGVCDDFNDNEKLEEVISNLIYDGKKIKKIRRNISKNGRRFLKKYNMKKAKMLIDKLLESNTEL